MLKAFGIAFGVILGAAAAYIGVAAIIVAAIITANHVFG
jgi:hypothetical protein